MEVHVTGSICQVKQKNRRINVWKCFVCKPPTEHLQKMIDKELNSKIKSHVSSVPNDNDISSNTGSIVLGTSLTSNNTVCNS